MIRFPKKKIEISTEIATKTIWVSTFLAMILTLPPLGLFLGSYFLTGNIIVSAILGFGSHFIILAFSSKISKLLSNVMS